MQELMFTVPIPPLLVLGFLIGVILLLIGYRENTDLTKRNHLIGLGLIIIGIMIPTTPITWYGYLMATTMFVLGLVEITILVVALLIGVILIYIGAKTYSRSQ